VPSQGVVPPAQLQKRRRRHVPSDAS
jgi:hypothetical protein